MREYNNGSSLKDGLVVDVVHSIARRRMLTIWNHHAVGVVRLALTPNLPDCWQHRAASVR